ncbi:VOC family protein [Robertkochia aurantiaca]|uniref:VOC family protein n=1 Tax=Robertkochia aurantiaca TaxID=2873700 RepID=UPI001CCE1DC1|nr:VOC family protein [Robertkochia sp. 3YJGBD-33]
MKTVWLNLPSKNLQLTKRFYREIGFRENPMHRGADHLGSFLLGDSNFVVMVFPEEAFTRFTGNDVTDTASGNEMLLNLDAQSREEVDIMAQTVIEAGGEVFAEPSEVDGWMYVMGFTDPDGHRWSMLYMDPQKMS